jgi:hypothetical protein
MMYRRCKDCAYIKCTKCFNEFGMNHRGFCKLGNGPFPTLSQEQEILARHGGQAPERPAKFSEPHSGWQEAAQTDTEGMTLSMKRTSSALLARNSQVAFQKQPNTLEKPVEFLSINLREEVLEVHPCAL